MNRQLEEKLKSRESEILRLRDNSQKGSIINSRRQSTQKYSENTDSDEHLKSLLDDKEHEISVRKYIPYTF